MPDTPRELVIIGLTESGKTFRPSDWAERLCGVMALFDPQARNGFSADVRPIVANRVKYALIDARVELIEPAAFEFRPGFARDNALRVRRGRRALRPEGDASVLVTHEAPGDA
jgi:trehalose utilization protein